jgi:hypothetical protein
VHPAVEALRCYSTRIDALMIGDFVLEKQAGAPAWGK